MCSSDLWRSIVRKLFIGATFVAMENHRTDSIPNDSYPVKSDRLLDDGMSCEAIAKVLLLDDDTIRTWYRLYEEDGIEGLTNFGYEGSAC